MKRCAKIEERRAKSEMQAGARRRCGSGSAFRPAFTMTELLVSLAVIIIVMSIVTHVFSVAGKTTATSQGIAEIGTAVENLTRELEADLRACKPAESVLVIGGFTQGAAVSEELRQANKFYRVLTGDPSQVDPAFNPEGPSPGAANTSFQQFSDPRADLLMFFTMRPTASRVPAQLGGAALSPGQRALAYGAKVAPVQVVYGIAALAETTQQSDGTYALSRIQHIQQILGAAPDPLRMSRLPLRSWRLARSARIVEQVDSAGLGSANELAYSTQAARALLTQTGTYVDTRGGTNSERAGDSVALDYRSFMSLFDPTNGAYPFNGNSSAVALASPYLFSATGQAYPANTPPTVNSVLSLDPLYDTLFPDADIDGDGTNERTFRHFATIVADPPVPLRANADMEMVAGCGWFQVELLMPEDSKNSWSHPDGARRADKLRWVSVEPGETYVFVPDSAANRALIESQVDTSSPPLVVNNTRLATFLPVTQPVPAGSQPRGSDMRVRCWPYAIRVTVRVFDPKGRLADPVVRSIEHWFE